MKNNQALRTEPLLCIVLIKNVTLNSNSRALCLKFRAFILNIKLKEEY